MKKRTKIILVSIPIITLVFMIITNSLVKNAAKGKTFTSVINIKKNKVGLVLGTSKYLSNGTINLYFQYRIDATLELFNAGKIEFILISGDNSTKSYDEPTDFKNELIQRGIPANKIFLDFAGFRTLDSVVRAKEIFGQTSITIISQKFHNERAIYLAEKKGMIAIGFNAKDVKKSAGFKTILREYFARSKATIDLFFGVNPKFLGKKIAIK
jgi:SanA protein